jgi:DNA-binding protein Fis
MQIEIHITSKDFICAQIEFEKAIYEKAFIFAKYNQTISAHLLGVSRVTFRTKLKEHFGNKYFKEKDNE